MTVQHETTLRGLARETFGETGNTERAIAKAIERIEQDRALYKSLATELIKTAVSSAVYTVVAGQRREITAALTTPSESTVRGAQLHAMACWMDFVVGSQPLGELTQKEILENVALREKGLRTEMLTLKWLRAVAGELSAPGVKVKHELKEADLARIRRKVERDGSSQSLTANQKPEAAAVA